MIVTANEAKALWCPFVRANNSLRDDPVPVNRFGRSDCNCLADGCMMWIWYNNPSNPEKRRGFCGLAQKRDRLI